MRQGIVVYTSNRLEELLEALADWLGKAPLPPLQTETIVVPGQGLARWLQLRLAERQGIAAGLALPFPGAFLQRLSRYGVGAGQDLFSRDVLHWRLWRLLADAALQAELGPAADYCANDADGRKRFQLCLRLASCLDDYQLYRPDLLARAAAGDDLADLGAHGPWQARLWRALLRDAGLAPPARGPRRRIDATPLLFPELATTPEVATVATAHRLASLAALLADPQAARTALPPRLAVFGAGTLPPGLLDVLRQIAAHIQVALFVPLPSPHYFGDLRARHFAGGAGNTLLARLGQQAREFVDLLQDLETRAAAVGYHHVELGAGTTRADGPARTLLACVQDDIAAVIDRGSPDTPEQYQLRLDDDSLRVHDCHSPQRELEVVRDQILAAFARDPRLEPHDVLVLVPDIDTYAPYAHAVFGPVAEHLPFHVADRSPASELPLCASLFAVLRLARERLAVFDVLHLLEEPALQRRFGLFAGDLPVLRNRCERAGIRWGLDGAMRERQFHVPAFEENSWSLGLDRLLLGVATGPEQDLVAGLLPVGDTTDGREELLARFVGFLRTLFDLLQPLQRSHPLPVWADLLDGLVAELYAETTADDETALAHVRVATANLRSLATTARGREPISPIVLQDWLSAAMRQATSTRGFLAGSVTVAAMLPMRMVPVRCLFLCGLHDLAFPRRDQPAPFDLIASHRRAGDRSLRLDDRQMFLDALLAARERLHITFVGHSQKDDSECAPSVVLSELFEVIDRGCVAPPGFARPRDFMVVRHPLQPWSRRYRGSSDARLFTFAREEQQPLAVPPIDEAPWFVNDVPPPPELLRRELPFERLLEFWWHPCRFFLQHTLRVRVRNDDDIDAATEPFAVGNLDRWRLQDDAVRRALRGTDPPGDPLALARATGLLPIGGHGAAAFAAVDEQTQQFLHEVTAHGQLGRRPLRVAGPDCVIHGELHGVGVDELVYARIANLKPKDRLRGWLSHVLCAMARLQGDGALPDRTRLIGKDETIVFQPLPEAIARQQFEELVTGYRLGVHGPLPFFENSSHAYGKALHKGDDAAAALRDARREWLPNSGNSWASSDSENPAIALCMRGREAVRLPAFADWARRIWTVVHGYTTEDQ